MKKVIIIIGSIVVAFVLLVLHSQTYSLLDIEADNYKHKLKETNDLIWESGIDNCIPENISLLNSDNYSIYQSNGLHIEKTQTSPTRTRVTIGNTPSYLIYNTYFEKNKGPVSVVVENLTRKFKLKDIFDKLILKEGFILKQSLLINGDDILIKETKGFFIIVKILKKYDSSIPSNGFVISTYSKRRFF